MQQAAANQKKKKAAKAERQQEAARHIHAGEDPVNMDADLAILYPSDPNVGSPRDESSEVVVEVLPEHRGRTSTPSERERGVGESSKAPESRKCATSGDASRGRGSKQARSPPRRLEASTAPQPPATGARACDGQSEERSCVPVTQELGNAPGPRQQLRWGWHELAVSAANTPFAPRPGGSPSPVASGGGGRRPPSIPEFKVPPMA